MPQLRLLIEHLQVVVNIAGALCPRRIRYRLARLTERHGANALLDDVLRAIVGRCGARCRARFADLPEPPPLRRRLRSPGSR